jgi:hypothetical protein
MTEMAASSLANAARYEIFFAKARRITSWIFIVRSRAGYRVVVHACLQACILLPGRFLEADSCVN